MAVSSADNPFQALGLSPHLVAAVAALGFEQPTPIQSRAIPVLMEGRDVIGQAHTGTGKTAAYGLPMLERLDSSRRHPQALILVPTRELAVQACAQLDQLSGESGLGVLAIYGGQPIFHQLKALKAGPQVIVGTPGRVLDHLQRGSLDLSQVSFCALDEADEMLAFGFLEEVEALLRALPTARQTALFSATFPERVMRLVRTFLPQSVKIEFSDPRRTVEAIRQRAFEVPPSHRVEALSRLLESEQPELALVFCRTRQETQELTTALRGRGVLAECLNGEMGQPERDRVMERFRSGQCRLLVATDVAARGLDLEQLSHVINYGLAGDFEQYVHRIGRTGRAGRAGEAITLFEPRERRALMLLERFMGARIQICPLPNQAQLTRGRQERFRRLLHERLCGLQATPFPEALEQLLGQHDLEQLARAGLLAMWEAGGFSQPLPAEVPPVRVAGRGPTAWLKVPAGRRDGIRPRDLVLACAQELGVASQHLGAIRIEDRKSFIEIAAAPLESTLKRLPQARLLDKRIQICPPPDRTPPPAPGKPKRRPGGPARS